MQSIIENTLMGLLVLTGVASIATSSRKSGYIFGFRVNAKGVYSIDKGRLEDFFRKILIIASSCFAIFLLITKDIFTAFIYSFLFTFFVGYALAWQTVIKLK